MTTDRQLKSGFSASRLDRIGPEMQRYIDADDVAGVVAVICRGGDTVYRGCHGLMDIDAGKPMREDAIFRIFSMSKPVTAAAALVLFEEGRYLLDDPISRFLPAFKSMRVLVGGTAEAPLLIDAEHEITFRHLFMHTSGLVYPDANGSPVQRLCAEASWRDVDVTLADMSVVLANLPLNHHPGSAWHYGLSTDLLGYLAEVISETPFDVFLKERLFGPLGMVDTDFYAPADKAERVAVCYTHAEDGALKKATKALDHKTRPSLLLGGSGLYSTATDYGRFCQMLLNGGELDGERVLAPRTVDLMLANHTPMDAIPVVPDAWPYREGYGMGLGVRTLVDVAQSGMPGSVGIATWQGAAGTDFWVDPKEGIYGLLMTQIMPGGPYGPAQALRVLTYSALME